MNARDAISAADLVGEYDDESVPQCPDCGRYHDGDCDEESPRCPECGCDLETDEHGFDCSYDEFEL